MLRRLTVEGYSHLVARREPVALPEVASRGQGDHGPIIVVTIFLSEK